MPVRDETLRLAALQELRVLDTLPETVYDDVVRLAAQICGTPIALVSLLDDDRQWFKARVGLAVGETRRDLAFCAHAIVARDPVFVVEDATRDPRFRDNPLVTGEPHIRFYAGAPVVTAEGLALGTVCVIDTVPRKLDAAQASALQALARQTTALLELRRRTLASEQQALELERLSARAADERRRSAEMLDLVLRGGNLGLWDLHVPSGHFSINEREREMLGYSADETQPDAMKWRKLVHPDDLAELDQAIVPHLDGKVGFYGCEHRMRHRDGRWVWVQSRAVIVERDARGVPLRIVGTHMDVTERHDRERVLQRTRELLQRMGTLAGVGGWELELASGQITWTDEVYRIHEVDKTTPLALLRNIEFYAPEARPIVQAAVDDAIANRTSWDLELPFTTAKGRRLTVRTRGEPVLENGRVVRLFGAFHDITDRKLAERALIDSERRLRLIADNLPALIAYIDKEQRYRFLSAHIQRVFGTDLAAAQGRTMREIRGEAAYAALAPHVEAALRGEPAVFGYTDQVGGRSLHFRSSYVPDIDASGTVQGFYAMTFDITELHESQRQLELLARVDTLTGLPNRRQFDERIAEAMLRSRRLKQTVALMFLDIDHFKRINDSLGHAGGDAVLREFAQRIGGCVRSTDMVARLAGDEFVVLLEGVQDARELAAIAEKVVGCIRPVFRVAGAAIEVTTSVGVAAGLGEWLSATELLSRADAALYEAKKQGRDRYALA